MTVGDLYETYTAQLTKHARRLTADKDNADDLLQETFIRAMRNLRLLKSLSPHRRRAWLFRTMGNLFVDKQRARRRERAFLGTLHQILKEESIQKTAGWRSDTDAHIFETISIPEIMRHIPEKDHDLFHMRFVTGMTSEEIASRTGIPASTVRFRLHVAIRKLRARKSRFA
ncbi:MAG: RNA polymerase sigma factor [Gemmatimonadetes bacterium]|nr:RNA polymerase sigma factor [Gemmatimonadota bacterium]